VSARRDVAFVMAEYGLSERQACKLLEVDRSSLRYEARPDRNSELRKRLVVLAQKKRRYGYRRLWVLLRREGRGVNLKRVYRLYREARLGVRLAVRKRLKRPAPEGLPLRAANEEWALDFVSDAVAGGGRIRILTVLDGYTRQCPGIEVGASIGSWRVTRALERMIARWGAPKRLRCDNVLTQKSRAICWAHIACHSLPRLQFPGEATRQAFPSARFARA